MPPMYRESPFWYKRSYPSIMASFSAAFRQPDGCTYILTNYPRPTFEKDGVHLSTDEGPRYDFLKERLTLVKIAAIAPFHKLLFILFRFICHMVEEVFKFGDSRLDPTLESCLNLQANHNEGFAQRLTDVEFILAEVTVRQEEERDGRLNERCVTCFLFYKLFIL